jgi:hypothetical protein
MDGLKAYKYYMAVKLHFTKDDFNVFVNRGKIKCSRDAFNRRSDSYLFEKLAKRFDDREYIQFLAANFAYGNQEIAYKIEESEENYIEWNRRKQSITKIFSDDLSEILKNNFTKNLEKAIIDLYLGNKICLETVRIIDDLHPILDKVKQNSQFMLMFDSEIRRLEKSKGFIKYKLERVSPIFNNFLEEFNEI